jgi:hypothetical protein
MLAMAWFGLLWSSEGEFMRFLLIAMAAATLTGCATNATLYQWGNYDAMLYQSYKNPEKSRDLQTGLETHIANMESSKQKVAPGLYAELGTLYMQAGDTSRAVSMYTKERDAWPESRGLMDALIVNISKTQNTKPAAKS